MMSSVVEQLRNWLRLEPEEEPTVEVREEPQPGPLDYPRSFAEFIGQTGTATILKAEVAASLKEGTSFPHTLLFGPPGCGKSALAYVVAGELGDVPVYESSGAEYATQVQVLEAAGRVGRLLQAYGRAIWLIDECDGLPRVSAYPLFSLMTHGFMSYNGERYYGEGVSVIATTNRPAGIPRALRSRFAHCLFVGFYSAAELATIAQQAAQRKGAPISDKLASWIGENSAGEPRKALHLLRALFVLGATTPESAGDALAMAGLHRGGLSTVQVDYLRYLADIGGTAGLSTLAAYLGLDRQDIQFDQEQYLVRSKMVMIGRGGRTLTKRGRAVPAIEVE